VRPNLLGDRRRALRPVQGPAADPNAPFSYSQHFRTPSKDFAPVSAWPGASRPRPWCAPASECSTSPCPTNLWYNTFINSGNPLAYSASIPSSSPAGARLPKVIALTPGAVPPSADITPSRRNFRNAYTTQHSVQITRPDQERFAYGRVC